jgi:hypothetical protein
MIVKLLSGDLYHVDAPTITEAKRQLSILLSLPSYSLKLLDPSTGLPLSSLADHALLYCSLADLDLTEFKEYEHYPDLFLRHDNGLIYPKLSPEEFKEAITSVDIITENNIIIYKMTGLFTYLCLYLHPYAFVDYIPLLSYYHFDDEDVALRIQEALSERDLPEEELEEIAELTLQKLGKK